MIVNDDTTLARDFANSTLQPRIGDRRAAYLSKGKSGGEQSDDLVVGCMGPRQCHGATLRGAT